MSTTTRLGMYKPVVSDLANPVTAITQQMQIIDAFVGIGIFTSSTRPVAPYTGYPIFETDTGLIKKWNGSTWVTAAQTVPTTALGEVAFVSSTSDGSSTSGNGTEVGPYLTATFYGEVGKGYLIRAYFNIGRNSATEVYAKSRLRIANGTSVAKTDTLLCDIPTVIDDKILGIPADFKIMTYYKPSTSGTYAVGLFLSRYSSSGIDTFFKGSSFNVLSVEDTGTAI